jgi:hypothetical protein
MNNETTTYTTKDQFMATVLLASQMSLTNYQWIGGACFFTFDGRDQCAEIIQRYFADELNMSAKKLLDAFKTVKEIIYSSEAD